MKVKRQAISNLLKSLKEFPPFRVSATEYENGTIEGKVTFMKQEINSSNKYVTHKELQGELKIFVTKKEFNEFREEVKFQFQKVDNKFKKLRTELNDKFQELRTELQQSKIETNNRFKELKLEVNNKFEELKRIIIQQRV